MVDMLSHLEGLIWEIVSEHGHKQCYEERVSTAHIRTVLDIEPLDACRMQTIGRRIYELCGRLGDEIDQAAW
jgi:hypothetical protein